MASAAAPLLLIDPGTAAAAAAEHQGRKALAGSGYHQSIITFSRVRVSSEYLTKSDLYPRSWLKPMRGEEVLLTTHTSD